MVAGVFGWTGEDLAFMEFQKTAVGFADDALFDIWGRAGLGKEGDFEEHAAGQVHALKEFEIDVHMEGELALAFESFLFRCDLGVSLDHDALGEELLLSAGATNFLERGLGLVDKVCTEGAEAYLNERTVEENLRVDGKIGDGLLKM